MVIMLILLFVLAILALIATLAAGAVLGFLYAAMSSGLTLGARVALFLLLAAGSAATWLTGTGAGTPWQPAIVVLSSTATVVAGVTYLTRAALKRRPPRPPVAAWTIPRPPATGH
ncbi:hypothetical protein ACWGE1_04400 [Streptomyces sp. NPDC054932]